MKWEVNETAELGTPLRTKNQELLETTVPTVVSRSHDLAIGIGI